MFPFIVINDKLFLISLLLYTRTPLLEKIARLHVSGLLQHSLRARSNSFFYTNFP